MLFGHLLLRGSVFLHGPDERRSQKEEPERKICLPDGLNLVDCPDKAINSSYYALDSANSCSSLQLTVWTIRLV